MITVRDVDARVGARPLLSGISFHVSPGDRIGLVGRNGADKTTLLNTLAGTVRPAAGTVVRTGDVGPPPPGLPRRRPVGDRRPPDRAGWSTATGCASGTSPRNTTGWSVA